MDESWRLPPIGRSDPDDDLPAGEFEVVLRSAQRGYLDRSTDPEAPESAERTVRLSASKIREALDSGRYLFTTRRCADGTVRHELTRSRSRSTTRALDARGHLMEER